MNRLLKALKILIHGDKEPAVLPVSTLGNPLSSVPVTSTAALSGFTTAKEYKYANSDAPRYKDEWVFWCIASGTYWREVFGKRTEYPNQQFSVYVNHVQKKAKCVGAGTTGYLDYYALVKEQTIVHIGSKR